MRRDDTEGGGLFMDEHKPEEEVFRGQSLKRRLSKGCRCSSRGGLCSSSRFLFVAAAIIIPLAFMVPVAMLTC